MRTGLGTLITIVVCMSAAFARETKLSGAEITALLEDHAMIGESARQDMVLLRHDALWRVLCFHFFERPMDFGQTLEVAKLILFIGPPV
jgi:hypothetical protein